MSKNDNKKVYLITSKGFTLIELMVVIAVVGFLSSIVFASLASVRSKANNSKITLSIREFKNALELYRSDHNSSYPLLTNPNNWVCIGKGYQGGICGWVDSGSALENTELNNAMLPYISSIPPSTKVIRFVYDNGVDPPHDEHFVGAVYICSSVAGNLCSNYSIEWILEGAISKCGNDGIAVTNVDSTLCFIGRQVLPQ